jgi:uncharacterized protein YdhG (YjbR/CyaY superfamily)
MRKVRSAIKSAAPKAEETFGYGMPGFKLNGRVLVWYAAWQKHFSLYPITAAIQRANAPALKGYETAKGTIRFPMTKPPPVTLIKRLVKARAAEVAKLPPR